MNSVRSMTRRALLAGALTVSVAASTFMPVAASDEEAIRLLSVDGPTGTMTILDGRSGEILGEFESVGGGFIAVASSESGEHFVVNNSMAGESTILSSGLRLEPHDDHFHLIEEEPIIKATIPLERPAHSWMHGDVIAIADDATGTVTLIQESDIGTDVAPTVITLATGPDHSSIAILGETLFIANYEGGEVQAYSLDGELLLEDIATCSGAHGETVVGDRVAFACAEGIVLITESGETEWIAYPSADASDATPSAAPELRSYALTGAEQSTIIAGDSPSGVLLFDISTGTSMLAATGAPILSVQYASSGRLVTAIDTEGMVYGIDPVSGDIMWSTLATTPFSSFSEDETGTFYPFLSNAAEFVYVANPDEGTIVGINTMNGEIVHSFAVEGNPARVTALVLSEDAH